MLHCEKITKNKEISREFNLRGPNTDENETILRGHGQWVIRCMSEGFDGYMLSFLFSDLGTNERVIKARMTEALVRAYSDSLTFIVRYPSKCPLDRLPVWIACADVPVFKRERQRVAETSRNNGLHYHAVVLIPPDSRLKVPFNTHLVERRERYCQRPIIQIGCEPIRNSPAYVTDYVLKGLRRRSRIDSDDILILPRTRAEVSR